MLRNRLSDEVGAAFVLVHLIDEVMDLLHHVLERALESMAGRHLPEQRLHHRQQIAVEQHVAPVVVLDGPHGYPPKLLMAAASSGWSSMKFCAPVMLSIVSTRR